MSALCQEQTLRRVDRTPEFEPTPPPISAARFLDLTQFTLTGIRNEYLIPNPHHRRFADKTVGTTLRDCLPEVS